ncbi:hypothetical protein [Pandoraea sputorum]|uniref:Uncharacterized protein n=1 Tax=Pandoraea sputorum TaxID=93222 RepID=A0A239SVR8_9BURK|nr:hypothetical protein [Pandoraea sputorum]AJC15155.1 hypothetical protein NA29_02250 [Pandoraea sputorum]SNU89605.1 Uncharacterised protein [Pandoraea sputorum]
MPEIEIAVSDDELELIEQVRATLALPSIEETATWLLKVRVREQMERVAGRRRAIYDVKKRGSAR